MSSSIALLRNSVTSIIRSTSSSACNFLPMNENNEYKFKKNRSLSNNLNDHTKNQLDYSAIRVPYKWDEQFANILEMFERKQGPPVEMLEISKVTDKNADCKVLRLQILIALILTYRNLPNSVTFAMERLRKKGCNIENLRTMPRDDVAECLSSINYYKQRANDIKQIVDILHEKYGNDIPYTLRDLWSLPGVKPDIAILITEYAWHRSEGIAVHMRLHTIANRLGWVETTAYEDTRYALEEYVPREKWGRISEVTYWFGTHICSVKPKCVSCLNRNVCPRLHARYLDD